MGDYFSFFISCIAWIVIPVFIVSNFINWIISLLPFQNKKQLMYILGVLIYPLIFICTPFLDKLPFILFPNEGTMDFPPVEFIYKVGLSLICCLVGLVNQFFLLKLRNN
jgi:hypothetical protein